MSTYEDRLNEIEHRSIDLMDGREGTDCHPHRPEVKVWADMDEDVGAHVTVMVNSLWGQGSRFVALLPQEARKLARLLNATADAVERAASQV